MLTDKPIEVFNLERSSELKVQLVKNETHSTHKPSDAIEDWFLVDIPISEFANYAVGLKPPSVRDRRSIHPETKIEENVRVVLFIPGSDRPIYKIADSHLHLPSRSAFYCVDLSTYIARVRVRDRRNRNESVIVQIAIPRDFQHDTLREVVRWLQRDSPI
jgi:hypothetical protein